MQFNFTYDANVGAVAKAAFEDVASLFENHFSDNVTLNVNVAFADLGAGGLGRSNFSLNTDTYTDIVNRLTSDASTTDDTNSVATLPGTDPITGTHTYWLARAAQKSLGILSGSDAGNDGSVSFSDIANRFDYDRTDGITAGLFDFAGTVSHELTEVMGRALLVGGTINTSPTPTPNGYYPLDLFHYSGAGARTFSGSTTGYFSIDDGTTNLADFNTVSGGDFGDWGGSVTNDAYLAFSNSGVVNETTLVDYRVMDILGWDFVNAGPTTSNLAKNVSEDGPTFSQDLLAGAADADGDFLFVNNLSASVTTSGSRSLVLGTDYTLAGATIALTAAGFAKFNSLAAGVSDTAVFNYKVNDLFSSVDNKLTLTINGSNDAPVASAISKSANEDGPAVTLAAIFSDPDSGDTHTFSFDATGTLGTVTQDGVGNFTYNPNGKFESLADGQTATDTFKYTVTDNHGASSTKTATVTIVGQNDAPIIVSGGGGEFATYVIRVNNSAVTKVLATDVDSGSNLTYSIVGGANAGLFAINATTGALAFKSLPVQPHNSYDVWVQASDGSSTNGTDLQKITVKVEAAQMAGDAALTSADTFVFHSKFGSNKVASYDSDQDFLQFDKGMFSQNTAAAVFAAAEDTKGGVTIRDLFHDNLVLDGVTKADLMSHADHFLFA